MYRHLDRELTLAELSAAMGTSPSTLSAVFRQCTGHAPMDFFTRLKMKQACRMLRSGGEYVYEVARQLGYRDPYYFSRAFKKVMGVSPRSYQNGLGRSDPPGDEDVKACRPRQPPEYIRCHPGSDSHSYIYKNASFLFPGVPV